MKEEPGEPTGRENKELDISESDHHEICDTNTGRVSQSGERIRKQKEHGKNWDQE